MSVHAPPASGDQGQPQPVTIVFFGLGAVGSSLLICLAEIAERDGVEVRFRVYTIDPAGARDALYHAGRARINHQPKTTLAR